MGMGVSGKIRTGASSTKGKPQAPAKGPSQKAPIVTPKQKGAKGGY